MDDLTVLTRLKSTDAQSVSETGGKAANLAKLLAGGFEVPDGIVVTCAAQREHIDDLVIQELTSNLVEVAQTDDQQTILELAQALRNAILEKALSEELISEISAALVDFEADRGFAVRSSAPFEDGGVSSWAGQFDTTLKVSAHEIEDAIKTCWASQFSPRALSYAGDKIKNIVDLGFAVIIQEFVPGNTSGVAFSTDPTVPSDSKLIIEAVSGTGESLVSGSETPLSVVMSKQEDIVLKRRLGDSKKDLLTVTQLRRISQEVQAIERYFGHPVDVEWTIKDGKLWILQARPITGMDIMATENNIDEIPSIEGYELTFKVTGLGFLFTDMLMRGFGYLNPLFTSNKLAFRQYFPDEKMEFAAKEGYRWLSTPGGIEAYRSEFTAFHLMADNRATEILAEPITKFSFGELVGLLSKYLEFYSKTDFQFTNVTYLYYDEDDVVRHSLDELAKFKEMARGWINDAVIDDEGFFATLLANVSSQLGVEGDALEAYKISEVLDAFDGERVSEDVLSDRTSAFVIFKDGESVHYTAGKNAEDYIVAASATEDRLSGSAIVGQVANKTVDSVVGKVCLINVDYDDLDKMELEIDAMEDGSILVSEFTAPELMGACKKASAIVTDLGGMLSHAAIVSRELGLPCVVGTRNASRSFSNGDQVRVDLLTGSVENTK